MTSAPPVPTPTTLPYWPADRFRVPCNEPLLHRLLEDMARHAGPLMPAPCWRLPDARTRDGLAGLLGDWCGSLGHHSLADQLRVENPVLPREVLDRGMDYIHALDHGGHFDGLGLADLGAANWRLFDLGSAIDFLLISAFDGWRGEAEVLEVGAGFGRLPEYFARAGRRFRYVNIDAVPASLMYCHEYLRRQCPDRSVLLYLDDDASREALGRGVDFVIVPAWHAQALLRGRKFDLCVNVESFQEMNQPLVDHYLALFDAHARDEALVYLMNARNYLFKGVYRYPERWECLLRHDTVRAWSGDQPTECFRVRREPAAAAGRVREYFYQRELQKALADPRRLDRRHG